MNILSKRGYGLSHSPDQPQTSLLLPSGDARPERILSKRSARALHLGAAFLLLTLARVTAQVPASDTTIFPVVTDNLPMVGVTTSYNHTEPDVTSDPTKALPLFAPYDDQSLPAFWDYLIAEQQQARIPLISTLR